MFNGMYVAGARSRVQTMCMCTCFENNLHICIYVDFAVQDKSFKKKIFLCCIIICIELHNFDKHISKISLCFSFF